jgi:hypothetical protein
MTMRLRRLSAASAALCAVACGSGHAPAPGGSVLRARGNAYVLYMTLASPSHVGGYGLRSFVAGTDLTLESVVPARLPPGVTLLATRVSWLRSADGGRVVHGYPGALCTDRWPPAGYGPTEEVAGTAVHAKDIVAFTLFLRAPGVGRFDVDGYDVTFRDAKGVRRHVREEGNNTVQIEALGPGQTSEHHVCDLVPDDAWLN